MGSSWSTLHHFSSFKWLILMIWIWWKLCCCYCCHCVLIKTIPFIFLVGKVQCLPSRIRKNLYKTCRGFQDKGYRNHTVFQKRLIITTLTGEVAPYIGLDGKRYEMFAKETHQDRWGKIRAKNDGQWGELVQHCIYQDWFHFWSSN